MKLSNKIRSMLIAIVWFVVSYFSSEIIFIMLMNRTLSSINLILVFSFVQFTIGLFIGIIVRKKQYSEVLIVMLMLVFVERVFFHDYLIFEVNFISTLSIVGDLLSGFAGFFVGIYLMSKKAR